MDETFEANGEFWHQRGADGAWFKWDESSRQWLRQRAAPTERPAAADTGLGHRRAPTPGYDYERGEDGIWWARDQKTGVLHWHDDEAGRWIRYQAPRSEIEKPAFPYARFWERFGASLVDGTLTGVVGYGLGWLLGSWLLEPGAPVQEVQDVLLLAQLLGILIGWLYFALMESSKLQATVGKRMVGLQVTDMTGARIGFGKATGRHFAKFLSVAVAGIGFLMVIWDDKKQGLHDRAAGTLVLKRGLNTLHPQLPVS